MVGLYRPRMPYGWHSRWRIMRKEQTEKPATERQRRILDVIRAFTAEHGYPPSVREIGERVGLSSSSTIHAHLKALEKRGLISRDPTKPRALRSGTPSPAADAVVLPILGRVAAGIPITAQEDVEGEFRPSDGLRAARLGRVYAPGAGRLDG